jgi:hypothetical protein
MKIPILKFKDLDEMLDWEIQNKSIIYTQTFKTLKREWDKNKARIDIDLYEIYLTEDEDLTMVTLSTFEDEWEEALTESLIYFENEEEYDMCQKINELLITIQNN